MHKKPRFNLKNNKCCAILQRDGEKRKLYPPSRGEENATYCYNFSNTYILQAVNQKTPELNEKSRAAGMCPGTTEAHSVCMLFSGAGVPLIGMFQGAAFFIATVGGKYNGYSY